MSGELSGSERDAGREILVSTQWLRVRLGDPTIRIIEVDVDPKQYRAGHIPGAIGLDWTTQLQDQVRRDIIGQEQFEQLLGSLGVNQHHTIVLYGDASNWFAAYAFWLLELYGHQDVRLLDGGRAKWLADDTLPVTDELPRLAAETYRARPANHLLRARILETLEASRHAVAGDHLGQLVDVRSPDEYSGKIVAPPGMTETAQRAGHIPGAVSVPWSSSVNADGTFKSASELRELYVKARGLNPSVPTIAYCRIGERSSHTWFVLRHVLGFRDVRNYDGSWTEYGSMIGLPIERSA
jgi:thiosulfate/3-mercaptopyruvate sulfurtransferase